MRMLTRYSGITLIAWFLLAAASSTRAQLPDMQLMANRVAEAITASRAASVVVIDFYGPRKNFTQLGVSLADNFNSDLKNTSVQATVQARDPMRDWLKSKELPSNAFKSIDMALWVAGQLKIQTVVAGNVLVRENELAVEVNLYRVDDRQWLKSFEITSQVSPGASELAAFPIADSRYTLDPHIAVAGRNGYTTPQCISCSQEAPYTDEAIKHRTQGSVVVAAIIGPDGIMQRLTVLDALPDGLTDRALDAVRQWKFTPAMGPDGKPATVQITIRLAFHFSHEHKNISQPARIR